ncbi:hypothetical protein NSA19_00935 [Actinomyces bowdenii]|uniref:hypothetical protein n=1 Tax=Actinomyces bowdenii TaxID=131109 RepID=UPI00214B27EC|nr:hypothetical protein [Actinomyces bowdenii]MCR2051441.1 hypothetical protein [Actinomyces bowdenii]
MEKIGEVPATDTAVSTEGDDGGDDDKGDGGATGATDALGQSGLAALRKERAARKAAEKRAEELAAQMKAAEDAGKTEAQKQAEDMANLRADFEAMRADKERAEIAAETGVPVEILGAATGDEARALAEAVKAYAAAAAKGAADEAKAGPIVQHRGNPSAPGSTSLAEQIAAAEKAGDKTLTANLKAMMLGR